MNPRRPALARPPQTLPPAFVHAFNSLSDQLGHERIDARVEWKPWSVVPHDADGKEPTVWHVAREAQDGSRREFVLNEVRRAKLFRSASGAQRACDQANRPQAQQAPKASRREAGRAAADLLASFVAVPLIAAALGWLGPRLDRAEAPAPRKASAPATAALAADIAACQAVHGPNASAVPLPDGQHRCTDKHGRRLPRSVITIAEKVSR